MLPYQEKTEILAAGVQCYAIFPPDFCRNTLFQFDYSQVSIKRAAFLMPTLGTKQAGCLIET